MTTDPTTHVLTYLLLIVAIGVVGAWAWELWQAIEWMITHTAP